MRQLASPPPHRTHMKRIFTMLMALALTFSLTACGNSGKDTPPPQPENTPTPEVTAPAQPEEPVVDEAPSGIQDDGIGQVIPLTEDEKASVLSHSTYTWLELTQIEKDELVVLMGRGLEDSNGYIVADYDDLIVMLDHQMEQCFRNGVDEGILHTTCDILGVALPADVPARPSGIWEDGMGDDPMFGEGIGHVIALSDDERDYMMSQTTNSWLELSQSEKDDLVVLVGRYLEDTTGFIIPDYDEMILMLDRQMEQYFRNGVDEGVLQTAQDIYGIA